MRRETLIVRFENRPGELASPDKSLDHSVCMSRSEMRRHLSKKFVIQSSSMFSGDACSANWGNAIAVIDSMFCCFFASSEKNLWIARR